MKKKLLAAIMTSVLGVVLLTGCTTENKEETSPVTEAKSDDEKNTEAEESESKEESSKDSENNADTKSDEMIKITVGATPAPHAEILEQVKGILAEQGYELEIVDYTDYVQPNQAVDGNELDANFFQHQPYLDEFNEARGTNLVAVAAVHYEPFGIYAGKTASLEALADGAQVAVPNDATNEARALLLLEAQGLIKLKEEVGMSATINDIVENEKNLNIVEIEAAQIPRSLQDVDIAVINGNYALEAGLNVNEDALAVEDASSVGATTYQNILVVKEGNENNEAIQALKAALTSETIRQFIEERYEGSVVPVFE